MRPQSAAAMRTSLEARLNSRAVALAIDPGRLRRRLVFQRLLRRLGSEQRWILKGGYLLEARLGQGFRSTRDLDIVTQVDDDVSRRLVIALGVDRDVDYFSFVVTGVRHIPGDTLGRTGSRISVDAIVDGRTFDKVRIDVLARADESEGATELITIPAPIDGLGMEAAAIRAVNVGQHAAEKLHAMSRIYGDGKISTRTKDLVDLALMLDAGLLPHDDLRSRVEKVFMLRDGAPPPSDLSQPPARWAEDFTTLSNGTAIAGIPMQTAFDAVRDLYQQLMTTEKER
jgi:hypothetical protein